MDGASVQVSPDLIIYRASALGGCETSLVAARLGYEPVPFPQATLDLFQAGHDAEITCKDLMRAEGWKIYDEQAEVVFKVSERVWVVGHIDGKCIGPRSGVAYTLEVKSQSADEWAHGSIWDGWLGDRYAWQASVYESCTGLSVIVARINRDTGQVKYEVIGPKYGEADIRTRVLLLESLARQGHLPNCDAPVYPCPYFRLHPSDDRIKLDDPQIDVLAREYATATSEVKRWSGIKDAARKGLRAGIVDDRVATSSGVKVTFYTAKNPPQISKELMVSDGLDPEKYVVTTTSERVKVTLPKGEE